jgi:hypothetical protein
MRKTFLATEITECIEKNSVVSACTEPQAHVWLNTLPLPLPFTAVDLALFRMNYNEHGLMPTHDESGSGGDGASL